MEDENPNLEENSSNIGYYAAPPKVGDETIKWQLDPTDVLDEIRNYYKQMVKTDDGWKTVFDGVEPFMTDEGINILMGSLRQYLNKNVVLSNLTDDEINKIMLDLVINVLAEFVVMGHERYNIRRENFNAIIHNTEHQIFCFLKRAKDNGERLRWMKTQQIMETHSKIEQPRPKRMGLF